MAPGKSRTYTVFESPVGKIYLIFFGSYLTDISFAKPAGMPFRNDSGHDEFNRELSSYFKGLNKNFSQKIMFLSGTDFEKKVWNAIKKIPYGETRTYKWVAEKVGNPSASRAVGRALSKNPIPIVIPCHRVVESDGSLGGFSSGIEKKRRLLDIEYYSTMGKK